MRKPYWQGERAALYGGDAIEVLRELPARSADCVIVSLPAHHGGDPIRDGGAVFALLRRVLAPGGGVWLHLPYLFQAEDPTGAAWHAVRARMADGWNLSETLILPPERATASPCGALLLLRRRDDCRLPGWRAVRPPIRQDAGAWRSNRTTGHLAPRFDPLAIDVAAWCVTRSCRDAGTVLDPYARGGAVGVAALGLGRRYLGIEAREAYLGLASRRLTFASGTAA
jgi:DNA modification methylase